MQLHRDSGPMNSAKVSGLLFNFDFLNSVRTASTVFLIEPAEYPSDMWARVLNGNSCFKSPPWLSMNVFHISRRVV